jgi:thiol:disulfide interchange protein DsbA
VRRAISLSRNYGITGVPSMIVNGKYRTNATSASINDPGGAKHANMLKVVDHLIKQESSVQKAGK